MENTHYKKAVFAGGCFWCTEACFRCVDGVISVVSGYAGGDSEHPTYESVSTGATGFKEAIQVIYDPVKISFEELLLVYWKNIDPTDSGGQFNDRGNQYETVIFYQNEEEKDLAEKSKKELEESKKFDKPIATQILPLKNFYEAEEYHQDYASKEPMLYGFYEKGSGRNTFLKSLWGDNPGIQNELKNKLSPLEYYVTQESGTEPPFENEYWDNKKEGIYVDVVSGEPLFSSLDKYDSGTGWPSFTKPLIPENIKLKEDNSLFSKRIEVKSRIADSHLGHVFDDGPAPEGKRYCLNSAALKFIAKENLKKEGYGIFEALFGK